LTTRKLAFGVDIGGTNVRVVLGDKKGIFLKRLSERTDITNGAEGVSRQILRMIRSIKLPKSGEDKIEGIGIGSAGPLNLAMGGLTNPTNIPYDFVPLVGPISEEMEKPTFLLNDCTMGVTGEKYFGAGKGLKNIVYITLSTGIGAGVYVDGHLLLGKDGNAAEIGHLTIDSSGCLPCSCGKRGHWEGYSSGKGIPNYCRMLLRKMRPSVYMNSVLSRLAFDSEENITAEMIFNAAKKGDSLCNEILHRVGIMNAIGFACVVDAYDPDIITVGGSVALSNQNLIIKPIREHIAEYARNRIPEIAITPLKEDVVLYGALARVFNPK